MGLRDCAPIWESVLKRLPVRRPAAATSLRSATGDIRTQVDELKGELTLHLRDRVLSDEDNQRLLNGVGAQHDRARVLAFLTEEGVEPTNNRAERDLRPAVIARKVSHCSRNERGARAFEAFTSVLQTIRKTNPTGLVAALTKLISPPAPA